MTSIDPKLLEILVCPACKTKVILDGNQIVCTNKTCALRFPIRDEIPVMLVDEAERPSL